MAQRKSGKFASETERLRQQQEFLLRHARLWQAQLERKPLPDAPSFKEDRRFSSPAWAASPFHDYLRQAYALNVEFLNRQFEQIPKAQSTHEAQLQAQWQFMMRQMLDALAPSNFAATNPEFIQTAIETQGESITAGIRNLLEDLAKGRISMTDDSAFEVGRNLATTPGAVVFENELMQLIQYAPQTDEVAEIPLLIVPPCINKFYILDLQVENSFVHHAVAQGMTVFLISWRNPQAAQGHLRWDDYVEQGVLRALSIATDIAQVPQINVLGFCVGGTLLTTSLAVARARNENPVASLTLLTTLLDFAEPGELGVFIDPASVALREATIGKGGLMKGSELASVFSALRANDLIWPYVVGNYLKGGSPAAFDLLYWNADSTNLPGPFAAWYLRNMYLENRLCRPGQLEVCGVKVDLGQVDMPSFIYASREDHIVPWQSAYRSRKLLSGPSTFVLGASGHIAGVINPPSKKRRSYWHHHNKGRLPCAERWLEGAREEVGSWWPFWLAWLGRQSGSMRSAPVSPGNRRYCKIESAPGRYVLEKTS